MGCSSIMLALGYLQTIDGKLKLLVKEKIKQCITAKIEAQTKKHNTTTHSLTEQSCWSKAHTAQKYTARTQPCVSPADISRITRGPNWQHVSIRGGTGVLWRWGPSIPPLSTSTLISSLLIQKAARAPSSPAMKTPQPQKNSSQREAPLVKYECTPADSR